MKFVFEEMIAGYQKLIAALQDRYNLPAPDKKTALPADVPKKKN